MDNVGYVSFVVSGIALTLAVGQLLLRSGQVYLQETFADKALATSVNRLLAVLFHLIMLGVLGVISTVEVPVTGTAQTVVTKLGVVLLVLGAGHGATMYGLGRLRDRRREQEMWDRMERVPTAHAEPAVTPA